MKEPKTLGELHNRLICRLRHAESLELYWYAKILRERLRWVESVLKTVPSETMIVLKHSGWYVYSKPGTPATHYFPWTVG